MAEKSIDSIISSLQKLALKNLEQANLSTNRKPRRAQTLEAYMKSMIAASISHVDEKILTKEELILILTGALHVVSRYETGVDVKD